MKSCVQILTQYATAMKVPLEGPRRVWGSWPSPHLGEGQVTLGHLGMSETFLGVLDWKER